MDRKEEEKLYCEEIYRIIREGRIYPVFQPVVSLKNGRILAYEALSRIEGESAFSDIECLFEQSKNFGCTWELEQLCRRRALSVVAKEEIIKNEKAKLFLNVSPYIIYDEKFRAGFTKEYLKRYQISPSQVVFEITEREAVEDMETFSQVMEHYKKQNYEIAMDDVGSGYSGLSLICEVEPHYIKLDRKLVEDIHTHRMKYAIAKGLLEMANVCGIHLIAEGIEKEEELKTLIELGIHYGQGYLLGRPDKQMKQINSAMVEKIQYINRK